MVSRQPKAPPTGKSSRSHNSSASVPMPSSKPGKGSGGALKRLREGLKAAGILSNAGAASGGNIKKHAKKYNAVDVKRAAKAKLFSLAAKERSANPFEHVFTRPKHVVLGRTVKGISGKPGLTRRRSEETRNQTLLVEMQNRHRESHVTDRRFGEGDASMSLEDKMLQRMMREKSGARAKGSMFNLEDGGDSSLTHLGKSLSEEGTDAFEDVGFSRVHGEDPDEDGTIDPTTVAYTHFGGFEEDNDPLRKKSKAEVMSEVIAKSKMHKRERQLIKEENEDLSREVDAEYDQVMALLNLDTKRRRQDTTANPNETPLGANRFPSLPSENERKENLSVAIPATTSTVPTQTSVSIHVESHHIHPDRQIRNGETPTTGKTQDTGYDSLFRELAFERRAKPQDRIKTEHEIAVERAQALITQEKERLERKKAIHCPLPGMEEDSEDDSEEDEASLPDEDSDESEDSSDDQEDYESKLNSPDSDLDENDSLSAGDSDTDKKDNTVTTMPFEKNDCSSSVSADLPFVFEMPNDLQEFLELIKNQSNANIITIIQRLHTLNSISLSRANLEKLETFLDILLQYCDHLMTVSKERPNGWELLKSVGAHMVEIALTLSESSFSFLQERIVAAQADFSRTFNAPEPYILWMCRLMGSIFSTSDFKHRLMTPVSLYLGQVLAQSSLKSDKDVLTGLFVCQLFLSYQKDSKRLIPEVFAWVSKATEFFLRQDCLTEESLDALPRVCGFEDLLGSTDVSMSHLIMTLVYVVEVLVKEQQESPCVIELFTSLEKSLKPLMEKWSTPDSKVQGGVKEALTRVLASIHHFIQTGHLKRRPLALQTHKPVAIPTYTPRFQEHYAVGRRYDPDTGRAAAAKATHEYKQELRGAVRELRKDAAFIARHALKEQAVKDAAYQTKIKGIMGMLANEEGAMRKDEKGRR